MGAAYSGMEIFNIIVEILQEMSSTSLITTLYMDADCLDFPESVSNNYIEILHRRKSFDLIRFIQNNITFLNISAKAIKQIGDAIDS